MWLVADCKRVGYALEIYSIKHAEDGKRVGYAAWASDKSVKLRVV